MNQNELIYLFFWVEKCNLIDKAKAGSIWDTAALCYIYIYVLHATLCIISEFSQVTNHN